MYNAYIINEIIVDTFNNVQNFISYRPLSLVRVPTYPVI